MPRWTLHHAKLEDWAASYTGPKFHAIFADPPYFLEFMNLDFDKPSPTAFPKPGNLGGFANGNRPSFARQGNKGVAAQEMFRIWGEALKPLLYPGALVFLFSGTRTWHRLACGMEDAGFEMWDTINWCSVREPDYQCGWFEWNYLQGMPKAQDVGNLIAAKVGSEHEAAIAFKSWKTASFKPAHEPILCFRLPSSNTYAENALAYGSGALNVDAARIGFASDADREQAHNNALGPVERYKTTKQIFDGGRASGGFADTHNPLGRYPANIILGPESAALLDAQSGERKAGSSLRGTEPSAPTDNCYGEYTRVPFTGYGDSGGASRMFMVAKTSPREREAGCDDLPVVAFGQSNGAKAAIARDEEYAESGTEFGINVVKRVRNPHPCLKPIALCKYLASVLLPPASVQPRRLLVPFAGVASEMVGALLAGWDEVVGVEQDSSYIPIGEARLKWWMEQSRDGLVTDPEAILAATYGPDDDIDRAALEKAGQGSLFV